jgi:hypothetical protein
MAADHLLLTGFVEEACLYATIFINHLSIDLAQIYRSRSEPTVNKRPSRVGDHTVVLLDHQAYRKCSLRQFVA